MDSPSKDVRCTESFQKSPESVERGGQEIYSAIEKALSSKRGCLVGRHGTTELQHILYPQIHSLHLLTAGVFPVEKTSIQEWRKMYFQATCESDLFAVGWYPPLAQQEVSLLDSVLQEKEEEQTHIPLRSLEPYYAKNPWTRILKGRRVCVVSSFVESMKQQIPKMESVWPNKEIVPTAEWSFVRSYFCPEVGGTKCVWDCSTWKEAVLKMEEQVVLENPEIVLLGCGGLAMPLAYLLKKRGMICVVMGGAIQTLFGIKGERWKHHAIIGKFWNDSWVSPSAEETPDGANFIEGGCYWERLPQKN